MRKLRHPKTRMTTATSAFLHHPARSAVALTAVGMLALAGALPASATTSDNLSGDNWKVSTIKADTNTWAAMSQAEADPAGGVAFNFETFGTITSGLDSVYLLTNVANIDLSATTLTAKVSVDAPAGARFFTRSTSCANGGADAYVRLEFQTIRGGTYSPSDYWWSTGDNRINVSSLVGGMPQTLAISTADPSMWSNINGKNGADPLYAAEFTDALSKVKQVGLSFGSACRYASGVAIQGGPGSFHLLDYSLS